MKALAILLLLMIVPVVAFAFQNPIDYASDTIRKNTNSAVDDAISKMKIAAKETQKEMTAGIKGFIKWLAGELLAIFTICAVGYTFSYMVPKQTGKAMLWVTGLCAINQFLRLFQ